MLLIWYSSFHFKINFRQEKNYLCCKVINVHTKDYNSYPFNVNIIILPN